MMLRKQGDVDKRKTYLSEEAGSLSVNPTSDNIPLVLDTSTHSAESEDSNSEYMGLGVHDPNVGEAKRVYFPEGKSPPVKASEIKIFQLPRGTNRGGMIKQMGALSKSQFQYNNLLVEPKIKKMGNIYPSRGQAGVVVSEEGIYPTVQQGKRGGKAAMPCVLVSPKSTSMHRQSSSTDSQTCLTSGTSPKSDQKNFQTLICSVGGFPCQSFRIAGKRRGFEDTRGTMFFEIARIAKVKRPKVMLLENVKGLLNHDEGKTFRVILETLWELGYETQWMVLNSKFFGVPQNRERVFIVASLGGECRLEILPFGGVCETPAELQGHEEVANTVHTRITADSNGTYIESGRETSMKLNSATKDGFSIARIGDGVRLEYPQSKTARGRVIRDLSNTLKNGNEGVVVPNIKEIVGVIPSDEYTRRPCLPPTISSEGGGMGGKTGLYQEGVRIRRLTPTECERLQGFPDNWTKFGILNGKVVEMSDSQRYRQCGNAVTTNVITAISKKLLKWFDTQ